MLKFIQFLFLACCFSFALPVFAQKSSECKPVLDAMLKAVTTDHSTTSKDSKGRTYESITAGGKIYIQINGQWKVGPQTVQERLQQEQENIQNAKTYTCKSLPATTIDGTAADVYEFHSESADVGTGEGTIWLSKSTGLPLKTEEDFTNEGDKRHLSLVYSYNNINAPAVK